MMMDGFARWILSAVPAVADRVPYVRQQAARVLALWQLDGLAPLAELLLTELVANAVRHARTPFSVMMRWNGRDLRCEVTDANPLPPRPQAIVDPFTTGGRGLLLVDQLAASWGTERVPHGKTVWFDLRAA
jgi:anti-sigma regulatory factor (Ser/Thr protein kinase)